jgi:hypothetical protein
MANILDSFLLTIFAEAVYDAAGIDFRYAGFQVATYPLKVKKISASFETLLQATTDSK